MGKMIVSNDRLKSFFLQCAQQSFHELGLNDSVITDYVASVLTTFAHTDHLYRVRTPKGRHLDSVVEMLSAYLNPADQLQHPVQREREFRKYVGDYTLFMSGLFRAHVEQDGVLDYYFSEGRRSYLKVSELDVALYHTGFLLFQELSKNFEYTGQRLYFLNIASPMSFGPASVTASRSKNSSPSNSQKLRPSCHTRPSFAASVVLENQRSSMPPR